MERLWLGRLVTTAKKDPDLDVIIVGGIGSERRSLESLLRYWQQV